MSSHAFRTAGSEVRIFRKSGGILCTVPVAISFLCIRVFYQMCYISSFDLNKYGSIMSKLVSVDNRNKGKTQDKEEKPGANLIERDKMPLFELAWIEPDMCKGANIFRNPYKKCSEDDRYEEWHTSFLVIHPEMRSGSKKDNEYIRKQKIANVVKKVV
jgi:hypothetical protein